MHVVDVVEKLCLCRTNLQELQYTVLPYTYKYFTVCKIFASLSLVQFSILNCGGLSSLLCKHQQWRAGVARVPSVCTLAVHVSLPAGPCSSLHLLLPRRGSRPLLNPGPGSAGNPTAPGGANNPPRPFPRPPAVCAGRAGGCMVEL